MTKVAWSRLISPLSAAVLSVSTMACAGEDAKKLPVEESRVPPTWDGASVQQRWQREGHGEAFALRTVDLDNDGNDEIILGGRGVLAMDRQTRETHQPRWSFNWMDSEGLHLTGDNQWTTAIEPVQANDDGVPDMIVVTAWKDGYLIDGATGQKLWHANFEAEFDTARATSFDGDDDGVADLFPTGGMSAYSGKTGEKLWTSSALETPTIFAVAGEFDGQPGRDLAVAIEPGGGIIIGPPPEEGEEPQDPVPQASPAVFALDRKTGNQIFDFAPEGNVLSLIVADLDRDGLDELIVGTSSGLIYAANANGEVWRAELGQSIVTQLAAADLDGDEKPEIFAAVMPETEDPPYVTAIGNDGTQLWKYAVGVRVLTMKTAQLDADPELELLVGGGENNTPPVGFALALDTPVSATRQKWRHNVGQPVLSVATGKVDGEQVALFGGEEATLHAVDPSTGTKKWDYFAGSWVLSSAAGDLDGDGLDEFASGDDRGVLALSAPANGKELWSRRLDVGGLGTINDILIRDVTNDGKPEVIAVGSRLYSPGSRGIVEIYAADGTQLASKRFPGEIWDVDVADLTGDGTMELVLAERRPDGCGIIVTDSLGTVLWQRAVSNSCEFDRVSVANMNDTPQLEIAYGDVTLFGLPHVALFDATGTQLWSHEVEIDTVWMQATPKGIVCGGYAPEYEGYVALRDPANGDVVWQYAMPVDENPDVPGSPYSAASHFGAIVPDQTGDGHFDIVSTSEVGTVHAIDGQSGSKLWVTRIEPEGLSMLERHVGGPVVYIPETDTIPAHLGVGQTSTLRLKSQGFLLKLTGEIIGSVPFEGDSMTAATGRFSKDSVGALFGGGLSVHALEAKK